MLTLTKLNNAYIKVESDLLKDVILNPSYYSAIKIHVKVNCCSEEYVDTITPSITYSVANVLKGVNVIVKKVHLINLRVGNTFIAYNNAKLITSSSSYTSIGNDINTFIKANFPSPINIAFSSDYSNAAYSTFSLTNLPDYIVPFLIEYEVDGIAKASIFENASALYGSILTSNAIYLTPTLVKALKFKDAVYTVTLELIKKSGSKTSDKQCFFYDCETKCAVAKQMFGLSEIDATELMMLHYSLHIGSNCGCNCNELCVIFNNLSTSLGTITSTVKPCGCD